MSTDRRTIMRQEKIDNSIDADLLWKGIGGHFDNLSQILYELVDNSISNFSANPNLAHRTILIHFDTSKLKSESNVKISVEDTGTGILELNEAFTLGSQEAKESPLNEHGFGLKHGLASANKNNDAWAVYTRTRSDVADNEVKIIESPYKTEEFYALIKPINDINYPTKLDNHGTGTIVEFTTNVEMFESIAPGGISRATSIVDFLVEDIGYVYSLLLKDGAANIQVQLNNEDKKTISAIMPNWKATLKPGNGRTTIDLSETSGSSPSGNVTLEYQFGLINPRERIKGSSISPKYYNHSIRSQGTEIRINGRLIKNNLLTEIWPTKVPHNSMNSFLVIINIISEEPDRLPPTRSSKNGFKAGDPRLLGVYKWVRSQMHEPYENKYERSENRLVDVLAQVKKNAFSGTFPDLKVVQEKRVLKLGKDKLSIDLYVSFAGHYQIYECKKSESNALDLYQLKLYWDSMVLDEEEVNSAFLVAPKHSPSVKYLVSYINKLLDGKGKKYNLILKTWKEENVDYPDEKVV